MRRAVPGSWSGADGPPEVLMAGDHGIDICHEVTGATL